MSEIPIDYAMLSTSQADASHVRTIAILHYVWGGLTMLFSCFSIIYIVFGVAFLAGKMQNPGSPPSQQPPPPAFGWIFVVMGSMALVLGWTCGILTILSGRWITQRRHRIFTLVMAGINCAWFPLGTTLGVFSFIVLLKDSVRLQYEARAAQG